MFDLSPVVSNLTKGLGVEAAELTDKLLDFEKGDSDEQK